jgi:formylglycine-generating enzyme required for sulfatase activity
MRAPLLFGSLLSLPLLAAPQGADLPKTEFVKSLPPGLVHIAGGKTKIGVDKKVIEAILETRPTAKTAIRALDAETGGAEMKVGDFNLGIYELTNEQYAAFVKATGHRPPQHWGEAAVARARDEFVQNIDNKRLVFDTAVWWDENWNSSQWAVPTDDLLRPVFFVSYADAIEYCAWAGLRLPTEEEFQRACRGNTDDPYPWGTDWKDNHYCATNEIRRVKKVFPVGSFEPGKSRDGIYDLVGNLWEWTSSPYQPYERFKRNTYTVGSGRTKEKLEPTPSWDGNQRVVVGGSYQNNLLAARATTRRPTERIEMTDAMGFRVASSTGVGIDAAHARMRDVLRSDARAEGATYMPDQVVAIDRWETRASEAADPLPAGYEIITDYDVILWVPVEELNDASDVQLYRDSLTTPIQLGFLSTTEAMLEPALEPGTYFVAFRAKGESRAAVTAEDDGGGKPDKDAAKQDGEQAQKQEPVADPLQGKIDIAQDNLLFFEIETGELAAHIALESAPSIKTLPKEPDFKWQQVEVKVKQKDDKGKDVLVPEARLRLDTAVLVPVRGRGFPLQITFKPDPIVLTKTWRR